LIRKSKRVDLSRADFSFRCFLFISAHFRQNNFFVASLDNV